MSVFVILVPLALLAVLFVLLLGVLNMAKGSSPERSQKLMQYRVLLQLAAIVVMMAALYFSSQG